MKTKRSAKSLFFGDDINRFVIYGMNAMLNILYVERRSLADVREETTNELGPEATPTQRYKALSRVSSTVLFLTFMLICIVGASIPLGTFVFRTTKTIADLQAVLLLGAPSLFFVMVLQLRTSRAERYSKDWVKAGRPDTEKAQPKLYFTNLDYCLAVIISVLCTTILFSFLY
jgi:hypothetical protein